MKRIPKRPPPAVRTWMTYLERAHRAKHRRELPEGLLERLGALCALCGGSDDPEAQAVYRALSALFFHHPHPNKWVPAAEELPPDPQKLARLGPCLRAYQQHVRSTLETRYRLRAVLRVMVQIPNADRYVKDCADGGLDRLSTIFHPNSLRAARKKYRGMFGYDSAGEHADQVRQRLKVVE